MVYASPGRIAIVEPVSIWTVIVTRKFCRACNLEKMVVRLQRTTTPVQDLPEKEEAPISQLISRQRGAVR